jgi:acetyl-CoA carboxylase carboxyltransferase component
VIALFAPNIVVGFARIADAAGGIIANQAKFMPACIDI